jgi:hypothetical protein
MLKKKRKEIPVTSFVDDTGYGIRGSILVESFYFLSLIEPGQVSYLRAHGR